MLDSPSLLTLRHPDTHPPLSKHREQEHDTGDVVATPQCPLSTCAKRFTINIELEHHIKWKHNRCDDCGKVAENLSKLSDHASETGHMPFACASKDCDKRFSRSDSLKRHLQKHARDERFECPHCYKHNGDKAFTRYDHLTQHLRQYHNIGLEKLRCKTASCPHRNCPTGDYRTGAYTDDGYPISGSAYWPHQARIADKDQAFRSLKQFQDHLRKVHDETPFQCLVPGCNRRGKKGWFR